jgi:hypothetical protein
MPQRLPRGSAEQTARTRALLRFLVARRTVIVVCAVVLLIAAVRAWVDVWNRDVSWFLDVSDRVMHGQRLYIDILEDNPPLIVWLGIPFVRLEQVSGFPAIAFYYAFTLSLVAWSAWCCDRVLQRDLAPEERAVLALFLVVFLAALPGFELGEREHLMLVLCLPYLALLAAPRSGLSLAGRIAIGLAAGIGFAFKPFFVLIWLAPLTAATARRGWSYLLAPEHLAVAGVLAVYGAIVVFLTPYLSIVPMLAAGYGSREALGLLTVVPVTLFLVLAVVAAMAMRWPARTRPLRDSLLAAGAAAWVVMFIQGKGFPYQYYPISALALLVLTLAAWGWATRADRRRGARRSLLTASLLVMTVSAPALAMSLTVTMLRGRAAFRRYVRDITAVVAPYRSVAVFSQIMHAAYPMIRYAHVRNVLPVPYFWFMPGFHPHGISSGKRIDEAVITPAELRIRRAIVDAMVAYPPDLIIVDIPPAMAGVPVDYLTYFSADPRFARLLHNYGFLANVDGCRILRRGLKFPAQPLPPVDGPCGPLISGQ